MGRREGGVSSMSTITQNHPPAPGV
ncbi:hypothetical protein RSOL_499920 [Rhizoctonia solani AG-3 Rhs1AP]|uniref:Uncharacterized protein n=1 Tax=Rhizoctonia solani AG-3 Rhs1AP TaxID=1086054 RepID=X8JTU1_9AGAM|nr:hypothetical protein RSOL_499920 [Rhizoctonia solani AG-3 Rhs1AP]